MQAAEALYHRLILVVGESGSGKTTILRALAEENHCPLINVSLAISKELLELTEKQRVLRLQEIIDKIADEVESPLFFDNLEILFDKQLKQDPLRLLQRISRNRIVIASWNGRYNNKRLSYAEIDHPEYRAYDSVDTLVVCMDGTSTIDSI